MKRPSDPVSLAALPALLALLTLLGGCAARRPQCPLACPAVFAPLCASLDGESRTFGNECEMRRQACTQNEDWEKLHDGECLTRECDLVCLAVEDLVCATYRGQYRTFNNDCYVSVHNCVNHEDWIIVRQGAC
ncbi:hypothetical protein ONE63_000072 [Megalurothrips usitatus]|uniref:Kazal-like domain-containing protein n=1 Tax=Megalurothrips usitatus TaxID=439358 RepID=A0AAV7Y4H8_9NEOP|nr:hypothetical protein ONE63_000072 [Megalurothrips usitatus]